MGEVAGGVDALAGVVGSVVGSGVEVALGVEYGGDGVVVAADGVDVGALGWCCGVAEFGG